VPWVPITLNPDVASVDATAVSLTTCDGRRVEWLALLSIRHEHHGLVSVNAVRFVPGLDQSGRRGSEHVADLLEGREPAIQGQLSQPLPGLTPERRQVDPRDVRVERGSSFPRAPWRRAAGFSGAAHPSIRSVIFPFSPA